MRVPYDTMKGEFCRVLTKKGLRKEKAELSARLFADASRDGVYTHGLNRFVKFMKSVDNGTVDLQAEASCAESYGFFERWDGHRGPGNLNAYRCTERAIELAKQYKIGVIGLRNTNHWMRPGNYGLMAVDNDCIGIFFTNTVPNMPPWGGKDAKLGNNPVVFAAPNGDTPMLVDVAMSMFSYGKLEAYKREGKLLPVEGGFNSKQELTKDPSEILETHESLPIGYWKGSGISLALDLIASTLSGGRTSKMVGELPAETELSQTFIVIDINQFPDRDEILRKISDTLEDLKLAEPVKEGVPVHFPGEHMKQIREENMKLGVPVDEHYWQNVLDM